MATREPYELWKEAAGDRSRYLQLLEEHGHLVKVQPCETCGESFRHLHRGDVVVLLDVFGHALR